MKLNNFSVIKSPLQASQLRDYIINRPPEYLDEFYPGTRHRYGDVGKYGKGYLKAAYNVQRVARDHQFHAYTINTERGPRRERVVGIATIATGRLAMAGKLVTALDLDFHITDKYRNAFYDVAGLLMHEAVELSRRRYTPDVFERLNVFVTLPEGPSDERLPKSELARYLPQQGMLADSTIINSNSLSVSHGEKALLDIHQPTIHYAFNEPLPEGKLPIFTEAQKGNDFPVIY